MDVGTNMRDDLYDDMPYWKVDVKPPWLQIRRTLAQQESAAGMSVMVWYASDGMGCHSRWFY